MSDHEAADLHHEDYVDVEELLRGSDEEDDVSPPVDDLLDLLTEVPLGYVDFWGAIESGGLFYNK